MDREFLGVTEDDIESILRLRRARTRVFGAGLFGDIAWDILLQLYAAKLGRRRVKLSDLDIPAPKSTVARWAAVLEQRGLIAWKLDPLKPRELAIELSSAGTIRMAGLFRSPHRQLATG